jgi:hypothetical protein
LSPPGFARPDSWPLPSRVGRRSVA